jgi:hypothetical protein
MEMVIFKFYLPTTSPSPHLGHLSKYSKTFHINGNGPKLNYGISKLMLILKFH